MNTNRFDVLVVGGGPGGSTAARLLSRRGYRVGLFEKEHMPRYKACGGGLCVRYPERVELDFTPLVIGWIEKLALTYEGHRRRRVEFLLPSGELGMVDRVAFDEHLWEQAAAAGVEVFADTAVRQIEISPGEVRLSTSHGRYEGRFLVGADGANSLVNQQLEIQPAAAGRLSVVIEVSRQDSSAVMGASAPVAPNEIMVSLGCVPGGYGWVFPKGPALSFGVFTIRTGSRDLRPWLQRYLARWGLEAEQLPAAMHGAWQRPGWAPGPWHKGRVLLVGDAGALSDPFTGEGISYALESAALAAETINEALRDGHDDLSAYSERIEAEVAFDFPHARRLARGFYCFPWLSFFLTARSRPLAQRFLDVIPGRLSYGEFNRLARKRFWGGIWGRTSK